MTLSVAQRVVVGTTVLTSVFVFGIEYLRRQADAIFYEQRRARDDLYLRGKWVPDAERVERLIDQLEAETTVARVEAVVERRRQRAIEVWDDRMPHPLDIVPNRHQTFFDIARQLERIDTKRLANKMREVGSTYH